MVEYFKKLFTDETAFVGAARSVIMLAGALATAGAVPGLPLWIGPTAMAVSAFIRAGDKNK